MSKLNTLRFALFCDKFSETEAVLDKARKKRDKELFELKRGLLSGDLKGDEFEELCVYEFGHGFETQYRRIKNLRGILEKHAGQYVQINTNPKELRGGAEYKKSIIGILDNSPLSVRKNKEETFLDLPMYSLDFNFKGEHIFYESYRLLYSGKDRLRGSSGPKLNLVKGHANLSASEFKKIEFSSDSNLGGENTIYAGNHLLPKMVGYFGIKDLEGVPDVNDLYDLLRENVKGLEVAEKKEKQIIELRKSIGLK